MLAFLAFVPLSAAIAEKNHKQQEEKQQTVVIKHPAVAKYDHKQQEEKQQVVAVLAHALFASPVPSKQSAEDTTH